MIRLNLSSFAHRVTSLAAPFAVLLALGGLVVLPGCSGVREAVGLTREAPDEFQVRVRAPLSMPREYGLKAPRPGISRPQEPRARDRARQIVLDSDGRGRDKNRNKLQIKGASKEETALLRKLGGGFVDPKIRELVERESKEFAEKQKTIADAILFWKKPPLPGLVINSRKEARRLQENTALGRQADAGEIPTITRKKKGMFSSDWFNNLF
ncbi:MAG: DUF3035 domain-containing protein [Alphaproteobacteria bacterium]